jgi:hypothetical protein
MHTKYLLPNKFKRIGWFLFVPAVILGIISWAYDWEPAFLDMPVWGFSGLEDLKGKLDLLHVQENNILNELLGVLLIVGGLFVAFSKEIDEDELIATIRLESLVWATYCNYAILIIAFLLIYDIAFFQVMVFNMFTILVLFIVKFNWALHKLRNSLVHEE